MKRAFKVKKKAFFIILKGLSVARICLRPRGLSLKYLKTITLADGLIKGTSSMLEKIVPKTMNV